MKDVKDCQRAPRFPVTTTSTRLKGTMKTMGHKIDRETPNKEKSQLKEGQDAKDQKCESTKPRAQIQNTESKRSKIKNLKADATIQEQKSRNLKPNA